MKKPQIILKNVPDDVVNAAYSAASTDRMDALRNMRSTQDATGGPDAFWTHHAWKLETFMKLLMQAWTAPK